MYVPIYRINTKFDYRRRYPWRRVAATGRLLTLARAYFIIHLHRAVAYDKQSIRAQIIFAAENPRLSSLPRRGSNLTARYLTK